MTTAYDVRSVSAPPSSRLLTAQLTRLLVAVFGSGLSLYLLASVVPLYLAANGSGGIGAGLSTGAMMLAAVGTEVFVPRMVARCGYRVVLGLGLVLMGAPSLVLLGTSSLPVVLAVCLIRGAGLAVMVVGAVALIAELTPSHRRGEAFGLYGLAIGLPAAFGLPLGVYLTTVIGFDALFLLAAVTALAGLAVLSELPAAGGVEEQHVNVLRGLRGSGLLMPALVFAAVTIASGASITFLPLAVSEDKHSLIAAALLMQSITAPCTRWLAGRYGDRVGPAKLLVPALLLAMVGAGALVMTGNAVAIIAGSTVFGLGFGATQNLTLTLMYHRVPKSRFGQVSALWNLAYDGGWGLGAIVFGAVVSGIGYPAAFGLTTAAVALAVVPAVKLVLSAKAELDL